MPRRPRRTSRRIALGAAWVLGAGAAAPAVALARGDLGRSDAGRDAGAPLAAAVPHGFRVARDVRGDLDTDGRPDAALVLEHERAGARGGRSRRLVVLRATGPGRFARAGEGRHVLLCSRCGGGPGPTPVDVRIRGGEVVVRQAYGRRVVTAQDLRFRLRSGGVRLARYGEVNRDRASGRWTRASTDLLTGRQVIETFSRDGVRTYDAFRDRPRRVALEDCLQGAPLTERS